jgi:hypothetical protein
MVVRELSMKYFQPGKDVDTFDGEPRDANLTMRIP